VSTELPNSLNSSNSFHIRRLSPSDVAGFRSIRLEALRNAPEAFGSTFERESSESLQYFVDRLERNVVFGGFFGDSLAGVAGFYRQEGIKMSHKGVLWGMYLKPEARGSGLAPILVERLLEHASQEVEQVQLTVVASNPRAIRFYERMGFVAYGLEKEALKDKDAYFDEVLMVKFLRKTE
jgi:ribosomal protein S18 acetylase RimI-like enzyme